MVSVPDNICMLAQYWVYVQTQPVFQVLRGVFVTGWVMTHIQRHAVIDTRHVSHASVLCLCAGTNGAAAHLHCTGDHRNPEACPLWPRGIHTQNTLSHTHTHTRFMKPVLYDREVLLLSRTNKRTHSPSLPSACTHTHTHTRTHEIYTASAPWTQGSSTHKQTHALSLSLPLSFFLSLSHTLLSLAFSLLHAHTHTN